MSAQRPYWYYTIIEECPVCGQQRRFRERHYDPKPLSAALRVAWVSAYDGCLPV
jgi:hypothetical protein